MAGTKTRFGNKSFGGAKAPFGPHVAPPLSAPDVLIVYRSTEIFFEFVIEW